MAGGDSFRKKATQCDWNTDDYSKPGNLEYSLTIEVFPYTSARGAHDDYVSFLKQDRERTKVDTGLPLTRIKPETALPGVAEEAYTVEATTQLAYYTGLVFRTANLLVAVQYERGGAEDGDRSTRKGAFTVTQRILESLSRTK